MPDVAPDDLRRMAAAIDAGLQPRVRLDADLSREAAEKLRDVLRAVAEEARRAAGVEASWPMLRGADVLDEALAGASSSAAAHPPMGLGPAGTGPARAKADPEGSPAVSPAVPPRTPD